MNKKMVYLCNELLLSKTKELQRKKITWMTLQVKNESKKSDTKNFKINDYTYATL
jgi:hypothetical protein